VSKLRVAVAGLGVGAEHARAFAAAGCEIAWLCDLDPARAEALAPELGAPRTTARFQDALDDPAVDAVAIATFDDAHAAQVLAALEAGKHVFVEKPLCTTAAELGAIAAAWRDQGERLWLSSNLVLRASPLWRRLREQIHAGALGRLYAFDGDYLYGRLEKLLHGWRGRIPDYSVLLGGGIHLIDLLLWLTGERPTAVSAVGNRISSQASGFPQPDFAAATFEFPSGLVGRVTANFGCVHRHQHVLRLFGTRASFLYDDAGARLHTSRDPALAPAPIPEAPLPPSKGALVPDFVRGVQSGADPAPHVREHFDTIAAALAATRALFEGRPAKVEYA
jgi:predicted dehydrogenase